MLSGLIESIVIIQSPGGCVGVMHFRDERYDRIVSSGNRYAIYGTIEFYIRNGRLGEILA